MAIVLAKGGLANSTKSQVTVCTCCSMEELYHFTFFGNPSDQNTRKPKI